MGFWDSGRERIRACLANDDSRKHPNSESKSSVRSVEGRDLNDLEYSFGSFFLETAEIGIGKPFCVEPVAADYRMRGFCAFTA